MINGDATRQDVADYIFVGMPVTLSSGGTDRHLANIIGWKRGEFILFEMPQGPTKEASRTTVMRRLPVRTKREATVRFMSDGVAYGFREMITEIAYFGTEPYCKIDWPIDFERLQVRRHHRVSLNGECAIRSASSEEFTAARIYDISESGIGIVCDEPIPAKTSISVSTPRHARLHLSAVKAEVRTVVEMDDKFRVGCEFVNLDPAITTAIRNLATVDIESGGGQSQIASHFVLGLTPSAADVRVFEKMNLRTAQFIECGAVAECMHLVYALDVVALMINACHDEWNAEEVCKFIRESNETKDIRIIVYGTGGEVDSSLADFAVDITTTGIDLTTLVDAYVEEVLSARIAM